MQIDGFMDQQADIEINRQAGRQTDRQTDRQTGHLAERKPHPQHEPQTYMFIDLFKIHAT